MSEKKMSVNKSVCKNSLDAKWQTVTAKQHRLSFGRFSGFDLTVAHDLIRFFNQH